MKNILVTGGSGFIGRNLCKKLANSGDQLVVLSRNPLKAAKVLPSSVRIIDDLNQLNQPVNILVNLAGEPIADRRWSEKRKETISQAAFKLHKSSMNILNMLSKRHL